MSQELERSPQLVAAVVCFAIAAACAAFAWRVVSHDGGRLVRVEAQFTPVVVDEMSKRDRDGKMRTQEASVDAVFSVDGTTYRHRVSEEYAVGVVQSLPGKGFILVDPKDPTRAPRPKSAGIFGAVPVLLSVLSAALGATFLIAGMRTER